MKNIVIILAFLGWLSTHAQSNAINYKSISDIKTIDNISYNLAQLQGAIHIYIFYAPECPLSQKYTLPIARLQQQYVDKIRFIGVFPGAPDSIAYASFKKKYDITYPLLNDQNFTLVSALKATITPEVFLLDQWGKIVYQGAIDDWVIRLGKTKQQASVNYLEKAIEALLHHTTIETPYIKPIGCYIEQ